jgi:hypothetical protein
MGRPERFSSLLEKYSKTAIKGLEDQSKDWLDQLCFIEKNFDGGLVYRS